MTATRRRKKARQSSRCVSGTKRMRRRSGHWRDAAERCRRQPRRPRKSLRRRSNGQPLTNTPSDVLFLKNNKRSRT